MNYKSFFIKLFGPIILLAVLQLTACKDKNTSPTKEAVVGEINTETPIKRTLTEISLSGSGYELGLQHGQQLKTEIAEIVSKWHENTSAVLKTDSHKVLQEFMAYADFTSAIQKWTPELYEEVRGIAEGSEQAFNDIMVLNLLDEFWVYMDDPNNHHCSDIGVPSRNGQSAMVAQNMDIDGYTDGYQTLIHLEGTADRPAQLFLTHPGLIALNGMNETGVGVVVNTIMQLKAEPDGLPVAFIVRKLMESTDKDKMLNFIQNVPHASGQNYIIGVDGEVFAFEASAGKVVRFNPENANGTVYHTNHPLVNDNLKSWYEAFQPKLLNESLQATSNTHIRFSSLENGIKNKQEITPQNIMNVLRSKDDPLNPVCRTWAPGKGFTFASTIMVLGDPPKMHITAGPPDESEYRIYGFD